MNAEGTAAVESEAVAFAGRKSAKLLLANVVMDV